MARTLRLLLEPVSPAPGARPLVADQAAARGRVLELTPGRPGVLALDRDGRLHLGSPDAGPAESGGDEQLLWLEALVREGRPILLAAVPPGLPPSRRPRRGGQPLPRVGLLAVGDVLSLVDGALVHVTAYRQAHVGPPPESLIGSTCPLCRVPIEAASRVYVCPCGVALHSETEALAGQESLQCSDISPECPACGQAIEMLSGYEHLPEGWA